MHALARQGIEVSGQHGDKGLALPCPHLRNLALVQDHGTDELDIKWAQPQHTLRGLARNLRRNERAVTTLSLHTAARKAGSYTERALSCKVPTPGMPFIGEMSSRTPPQRPLREHHPGMSPEPPAPAAPSSCPAAARLTGPACWAPAC